MYDLSIFYPVDVIYDEKSGIETLYLDAPADECDTLGIPRDKVTGARLTVAKRPHGMLHEKSVEYGVEHWNGKLMLHETRTLLADSDYDNNAMDMLWERSMEKIVPGYRPAVLELLDGYIAGK